MSTWSSLSDEISAAVEHAAPSVVQVHGRRRVAAGLVVSENIVLTPAAVDDGNVAVRAGDGHAVDGAVLGRIAHMGLTVLRIDGLGLRPLPVADDAKPGQLAVAVGRTWSGNVMSLLAPIAVVGGPLRMGRASWRAEASAKAAEIERVIRIQPSPHGALNGGALIDASGRVLGIVTSFAIRGTTVVIPASIALAAATRVVTGGGTKQGFLGVSSMPVMIPERQRAGRSQGMGLLISQVSPRSPADAAGLLVGDVIVGFDGEAIEDGEELVMRLRGDRIGKPFPLTVLRGTSVVDVTVTIGERPTT